VFRFDLRRLAAAKYYGNNLRHPRDRALAVLLDQLGARIVAITVDVAARVLEGAAEKEPEAKSAKIQIN
jgi:hypothetical protein